jgi:hypothetical protein
VSRPDPSPRARRPPRADRRSFFFETKTPLRLTVAPHARRSEFSATETRLLRAAVAAFLDLLNLSTRTLEKFGSVEAPAA